jgi:hypothetical protein
MNCSFNAQPQAPASIFTRAGACGWALNETSPAINPNTEIFFLSHAQDAGDVPRWSRVAKKPRANGASRIPARQVDALRDSLSWLR